jgi:flagellar hook-associated protein 3 FlgL
MRITESMRYESVLRDITRAKQRMLEAEQQVSSGKKVTKPSDDPVAASDILRIYGEKGQNYQFERNLTFAKSKLQLTDGVLTSLEGLVERARTVGQLAFGDTEQPSAYVSEIQSLRDQMMTSANTTFAGRFIFGGSMTTLPPYVKNPDSSITYNGNSDEMPMQIGRTAHVPTQIAGNELFSGPLNIFDVMADLAVAIEAGDKDGIDRNTKLVEQFSEVVGLARTKVGGHLNLISNVESDLMATKLAHETELSNKEAADLAKAITDLSMSQSGLEAALAVGANISQLSILKYLK